MNGYFRFGFIASILLLSFAAWLAFGNVETKTGVKPRWTVFLTASPNEIGDTLAGIAGALAFLWIIVTVMIQSSELRLQRRELAMTRKELHAQRAASEKMAKAQEAQVAALEAQTELLKHERRLRNEESAQELLEELFRSLAPLINQLSAGSILYKRRSIEGSYEPIKESFFSGSSYQESLGAEAVELYIKNTIAYIDGIYSQIGSRYSEADFSVGFDGISIGSVDELAKMLSEIIHLCPELSKAQTERLARLRVSRLLVIAKEIGTRMISLNESRQQ
jgi:hypothetical protein